MVLGASGHAVGWPIPARRSAGDHATRSSLTFKRSAAPLTLRSRVERSRCSRRIRPRLVRCHPQTTPAHRWRTLHAGLFAACCERYRYGPGVFKVDYALSQPIPWKAAECARAATVHVGGSLEEIAASEACRATRQACRASIRAVSAADFVRSQPRARRTSTSPGPIAMFRMARLSTCCRAWKHRSSASLPASAIACWRAASSARPISKPRTPTSSAATSTAGSRLAAVPLSSDLAAIRHARPKMSLSARRPLRRAEECMACAAITPLNAH